MKNGVLNQENMSKIGCVVNLSLLSMYANLGKFLTSLGPSFLQQVFIGHLIYASFCTSPQAHLRFFIFKMPKKKK